jgi:uncharacterized membrane protein
MIRRSLTPASEQGGEGMQKLQENWVNTRALSLLVIAVACTAAYETSLSARWWVATLFLVLFGTAIADAAGFRQKRRAS